MSFYDDSTIRKSKQIILDCCSPSDTLNLIVTNSRSASKNIARHSVKKLKIEVNKDQPVVKDVDEIGYAAT